MVAFCSVWQQDLQLQQEHKECTYTPKHCTHQSKVYSRVQQFRNSFFRGKEIIVVGEAKQTLFNNQMIE